MPAGRLRRADCSAPGIRRRRAGRGFSYVDPAGNRVTDPDTLARIRDLAIPPAWSDVWICPHPMGHIQAMGTDARGRRQYLYHDRWRQRRDAKKFDHMLDFARALPTIRRVAAEHLDQPGLTRERVLACAVRLLDLGLFRIGTEGYAEVNQTFGLATIQKRHVRIDGEVITFNYTAKGGKRHIQPVAAPDVVTVVAELKARRGGGRELLGYKGDDGRWHDVRSGDINSYIKDITGGDFSAKDFRTWSATVLAATALAVSSEASRSPGARQRAVARAMKEVAGYLGNTPAVCRSSYVDRRVIDRFAAGETARDSLEVLGRGTEAGELSTHGSFEKAVLRLLDGEATDGEVDGLAEVRAEAS